MNLVKFLDNSKGVKPERLKKIFDERGFTLFELLISMSISSILLATIMQSVFVLSKQTRDNQITARANEVAQAILDYMVFDVRLAGAGMPLGQSLFPIQAYSPAAWSSSTPPPNWGNATYPLGDAPWPIIPTSDATHLYLRLNERGIETVLSSSYDPGAGNVLNVIDLNDFTVGDIVYLYDRRLAGNAGLRGLITARNPSVNNSTGITPGTITIASTKNVSMNGGSPFVFSAGSSINRVSTLRYTSPSDGSGIQIAISDYDSTARAVYPNTRFSIVYKDRNGAAITFPSTVTTAADITAMLPNMINLGSVEITVTASGENKLSTGQAYQVSLSQDVALRNLLLSHY